MRRAAVFGGLGVAAAAAVLFLSPAKADPCPLLSNCEPQPTTTSTTWKPPPLPVPSTTTTTPRPDTAAAARRLLVLVNQERTSRGLRPLSRRSDVDSIGAGHSKNMADRRQLWHNDGYFTSATKDRIGAQYLGENVAMNASVEDMHRRLMNSPHHRDNILDGRFHVVGIGVAASSDGVLFATEDFAQLRGAAAPAPAAPSTAKARPKRPAGPSPAAQPSPAPPANDTSTTARDLPEVDLGDASQFAMGGGLGLPAGGSGRGSSPPMVPFALAALASLVLVVRFILHRQSVLAETQVDDPCAGGG